MSDLTDEQIAKEVRDAAYNLNKVMEKALRRGIETEVDTFDQNYLEGGTLTCVSVKTLKILR